MPTCSDLRPSRTGPGHGPSVYPSPGLPSLLAPLVRSGRCRLGGQEADEGQQPAPGLPAPGAAPVRLPGTAQLIAATRPPPPRDCVPHHPLRPWLFLEFVLGNILPPLGITVFHPDPAPHPGKWRAAEAAPDSPWGPIMPRSGTCVWVGRPGLFTSMFLLPSAFLGPV